MKAGKKTTLQRQTKPTLFHRLTDANRLVLLCLVLSTFFFVGCGSEDKQAIQQLCLKITRAENQPPDPSIGAGQPEHVRENLQSIAHERLHAQFTDEVIKESKLSKMGREKLEQFRDDCNNTADILEKYTYHAPGSSMQEGDFERLKALMNSQHLLFGEMAEVGRGGSWNKD